VRGVSVIAEQVWDVVALSRARREGRLAEILAATPAGIQAPLAGGATTRVAKVWHASGGSAGR
jgi:hypothetical protein